jgi:leader peptidase (prepilin peptidase)/N-methyltransferase
MAWIGVGIALVAALAMAACTAAILRRLPLPVDEPEARPYAELISPRLFVTVLISSLAALLTSLLLAEPARWPVWVVVGTVGVLLAVVDARTGFLPKKLTWWFGGLVLAATIAVAALAGNPLIVLIALLCGAGAGLIFRLLWQIGGGLGFGDVRLVTVLGMAAGATSVELAVWSLLLGGLAGVVWGLVVRLRRGKDGPFPYGPSLVMGPFLALIVQWWLPLAGLG